jgi:uncharacterized Zn-finger protein
MLLSSTTMMPESFQCDVCSECISEQDVKAHLQKHQAQLLNLLSRIPDTPIGSGDRSQVDSSHFKDLTTRRIRRTKRANFPCSKCDQTFARPHDYTRHFVRRKVYGYLRLEL